VRNPWGYENYNGKWSDLDTDSWTPEAKTALKHDNNMRDGSFFLTLDDFIKYSNGVNFFAYDDWEITVKQESWDRSNWNLLKWKIFNPIDQEVYFSF